MRWQRRREGGEQGDPAGGGRQIHVKKHTIQWEQGDFLNEKRTKFAAKLYTKFYLKIFT